MKEAKQLAGPNKPVSFTIRKTVATANTVTTVLKKFKVPVGKIIFVEAEIQALSTAGAQGLFLLKAAARNVAGTTSLLGTADLVSFRDGAEITVTIEADNTLDTLNILATAAIATNTSFKGQARMTEVSTAIT